MNQKEKEILKPIQQQNATLTTSTSLVEIVWTLQQSAENVLGTTI